MMDSENLYYAIFCGLLAFLLIRSNRIWLENKKRKSEGFSKEITKVQNFRSWMLIAFFILLSIVYFFKYHN